MMGSRICTKCGRLIPLDKWTGETTCGRCLEKEAIKKVLREEAKERAAALQKRREARILEEACIIREHDRRVREDEAIAGMIAIEQKAQEEKEIELYQSQIELKLAKFVSDEYEHRHMHDFFFRSDIHRRSSSRDLDEILDGMLREDALYFDDCDLW